MPWYGYSGIQLDENSCLDTVQLTDDQAVVANAEEDMNIFSKIRLLRGSRG